MATKAPITYTPEEYLALERQAEYKSEYINGEIYARSGASKEHNQITVNLTIEIGQHFRGKPCEVYSTDMRVKVPPAGMYTYPDLVAVCDDAVFDDTEFDTLINPNVIIEVLSPSTEAYDRGEKFAHYRRLPSLQEYVLISQDKARVERYLRRGDEWVLTELGGLTDTLHLPSVDCSVALDAIYEKVTFPTIEQREEA